MIKNKKRRRKEGGGARKWEGEWPWLTEQREEAMRGGGKVCNRSRFKKEVKRGWWW